MTSRRITVRVVGSDGRPVSDSAVAIVASTVPVPEVALKANDAGIVFLNLPAGGQFTLRATATDGRSGEALVTTSQTGDQLVEVILYP